ncbi:tetratricopeptide repeat protein [Hansschlegelia sp. KR7-227]|uniref:tetratricopeptide repeat protein n=1 Tax=Hansschlegelia sp. KR7-227 TaxID=3400914 RepID=UPI003C0DB8A2
MRRHALTLACMCLTVGGALAAPEPKKTERKPAQATPEMTGPGAPVPSLKDIMLLKPPGAAEPIPAPKEQAAGVAAEPPADPNADLAFGAFQRGLYRAAFEEARKRAEGKSPDRAAMTLLGVLYAGGYGVPRQVDEAVRWYQRAAKDGDREAMLALGLMKLQGLGGPKDPAAAAVWFEKAADKGEPEALYNLALMKLQQGASAQDLKEAARRLKAAAELGEAEAQYAYAVLLKEGRGVERDVTASTMWLGRAAEQGDVAAMVEYAIAVFNGAGAPKDEEQAAKLFRRAAERGNAIAQNRLARLYAYGRGMARDPVRAAAWHRLAESQGLNDAWLEGFVGTLPAEDREAAESLVKRWTVGFGPIAAAATTDASPPPKP